MAQQTAVEWLVEQLPQIDWDDPYYAGLLQEAERMEKEQIKDAFDDGYKLGDYELTNDDIENYYNETYNKQL